MHMQKQGRRGTAQYTWICIHCWPCLSLLSHTGIYRGFDSLLQFLFDMMVKEQMSFRTHICELSDPDICCRWTDMKGFTVHLCKPAGAFTHEVFLDVPVTQAWLYAIYTPAQHFNTFTSKCAQAVSSPHCHTQSNHSYPSRLLQTGRFPVSLSAGGIHGESPTYPWSSLISQPA